MNVIQILPWLVAAWLFGVGFYGIVTSRDLVHLVGCLTVCQSSTYVLLLGIGYRWGAGPPVFYDHPPGIAVDPVIQALVLTDIVIGAAVSALLLVLAIQVQKRTGTVDPQRVRALRSNR